MNNKIARLIKNLIAFLRKHGNRIANIFTNPHLLSFFISLIIIFTLPQIFDKYTAKTISKNKHVTYQNIYYTDLDSDNISEKISIETNYDNKTCLRVYKNNKVVEQWNFNGKYISSKPPFWNDVDTDGFAELFVFTNHDNKMFLNCVSPIINKILRSEREICDYIPFDKTNDCQLNFCGYFDKNKDGINEFYFFANTGFSVQPRQMFAYDLAKDTLYYSEKSCAGVEKVLADYGSKTNDLYFLTVSNAVGNCDGTVPYSDMYAWLMVFDKDLSFKYNPVKIGYYPSNSHVISLKNNKGTFFVVLNIYFGTNGHYSTLAVYDENLNKLKEKKFLYSDEWENAHLYCDEIGNPDYFYILKNNGTFERVDIGLNIIGKINSPLVDDLKYFVMDIDRDGKNELLLWNYNLQQLVIFRNDLSDYVTVNCPGANNIQSASLKLDGANLSELFVQSNNYMYTINYKANSLYYLRFPFYGGIYFIVFLFILLLQKTQRHRAELKYETEKRIIELQIKAIKNQVDPHFTLNIINSIGSLFYKQNKDKADYIFGKYSRLLRQTILNSDKIITTLADEFDYVKNYLDLEQFRYNDKFSYEIKTDHETNLGINIPKMLVHTFAENAIKHGLKHLEGKGELIITVTSTKNSCVVVIRDNGVGRKKAKTIEVDNTSKGLEILDQILELYKTLMKIKITYAIKDITDEKEQPLGTEVYITIPMG